MISVNLLVLFVRGAAVFDRSFRGFSGSDVAQRRSADSEPSCRYLHLGYNKVVTRRPHSSAELVRCRS